MFTSCFGVESFWNTKLLYNFNYTFFHLTFQIYCLFYTSDWNFAQYFRSISFSWSKQCSDSEMQSTGLILSPIASSWLVQHSARSLKPSFVQVSGLISSETIKPAETDCKHGDFQECKFLIRVSLRRQTRQVMVNSMWVTCATSTVTYYQLLMQRLS